MKNNESSNANEIVNIPLKNSQTDYTGLKVVNITPDQTLVEIVKSNQELCVVVISGYVDVKTRNLEFDNIGNRMTPFVEQGPHAFYIASNDFIEIKGVTHAEIAFCYGLSSQNHETRHIHPNNIEIESRGTGQMKRVAKDILPETEEADSLLIVEVITEGGNWSSFPSHRHDENNLPIQSQLEEIYYHKLNPSFGGFALQYVYNDDRSVNELYSIDNNTAVIVKEGYHPVAVPPGYSLYYLNVMAGPKRTWKFYNDPYFEQLLK